MTIKYTNDARTTLIDSITPTSTFLNVTSTLNFPTLVEGDYTYLTLSNATEAVKEIVKCTAIDGTMLTVVRGEESTIARIFDAGAHVQLRITAGLINEAIGESIYDDSALAEAVRLNTLKVSNVAHPLVETAVPTGALFTDTTYTSNSFTLSDLQGFNANEHINWGAASQGTIHSTNLPAISITSVQTATDSTAHLALTTEEGDVVIRTDEKRTYIRNAGVAGDLTDFTEIISPTDGVISVDGATGVIALDHDTLTGYVAAEHVDWALAATPNIHTSNYTNTVYDDTDIVEAVRLNTLKVSNIAHPTVGVEVPTDAVFTDTDTVYTAPLSEAIAYITGLQDALDSKLTPTGDGSQLTGIDALPIQTYQGGNFLTTDGTNATWQGLSFEIDGGSASSIYLPTQLVNGGPA